MNEHGKVVEQKTRIRKWGRPIFYLLAGVWWCFLTFERTGNWILRGITVILWIANTAGIAISSVSEAPGTLFDQHPLFSRALAAVFIVCGGVYVWVGARPPNTWFFGLFGVVLIGLGFLYALLHALLTSHEYLNAGKIQKDTTQNT